MQILARIAFVALVGIAAQVSAEPRVCIGGDLDRLSQTEKNSCKSVAERVRRDAVRFHAQDDWHFVVVCTESDWTTYAAVSERGTSLAALNVDTDAKHKMTFLRGATLAMGDTLFNRRLIAREAARGLLPGRMRRRSRSRWRRGLQQTGTEWLRWLLHGRAPLGFALLFAEVFRGVDLVDAPDLLCGGEGGGSPS